MMLGELNRPEHGAYVREVRVLDISIPEERLEWLLNGLREDVREASRISRIFRLLSRLLGYRWVQPKVKGRGKRFNHFVHTAILGVRKDRRDREGREMV